jgi:hypothetical protein
MIITAIPPANTVNINPVQVILMYYLQGRVASYDLGNMVILTM